MVERISAAPTGVPLPASRAPAASSKKEKKAKAKALAARKGGKTTQRTHTKKRCIDEVELRLNATQQTDGVGERTEEVLLALQLEGPDAVRELTRLLGLCV